MTATLIAPPLVASHSGAEYCCRALVESGFPLDRRPEALVAGCGAGHEAAYLQKRLDARVTAVDLELEVPPELADWPDLHFQQADVERLPFDDGHFDLVFYHHVIEHVGDPPRSLVELHRVLRPGGAIFIGTPNRHRLLSAVGAYRQRFWRATWRDKLRDNWIDWKARLTGRFRNELGAHAGFATGELDHMLKPLFSDRRWLTRPYLRFKYSHGAAKWLVRCATAGPLVWFMAPSIYVLCRKGGL